MGELLARLGTAQRHTQPGPASAVFHAGPLAVDLARHLVTIQGEPVRLTSTEYALLRLFIQNAGKVLTHTQLLREVWEAGYQTFAPDRGRAKWELSRVVTT